MRTFADVLEEQGRGASEAAPTKRQRRRTFADVLGDMPTPEEEAGLAGLTGGEGYLKRSGAPGMVGPATGEDLRLVGRRAVALAKNPAYGIKNALMNPPTVWEDYAKQWENLPEPERTRRLAWLEKQGFPAPKPIIRDLAASPMLEPGERTPPEPVPSTGSMAGDIAGNVAGFTMSPTGLAPLVATGPLFAPAKGASFLARLGWSMAHLGTVGGATTAVQGGNLAETAEATAWGAVTGVAFEAGPLGKYIKSLGKSSEVGLAKDLTAALAALYATTAAQSKMGGGPLFDRNVASGTIEMMLFKLYGEAKKAALTGGKGAEWLEVPEKRAREIARELADRIAADEREAARTREATRAVTQGFVSGEAGLETAEGGIPMMEGAPRVPRWPRGVPKAAEAGAAGGAEGARVPEEGTPGYEAWEEQFAPGAGRQRPRTFADVLEEGGVRNAIQEQGAKGMDVGQPSRNGEALGGGNAGLQGVAGEVAPGEVRGGEEAPRAPRPEEEKANPYLTMPLETVKDHAEQGVKLAQQALRARGKETVPEGVIVNGAQERPSKGPLMMYTDKETGTTFSVDESAGQTVEGELGKAREKYAKVGPVKTLPSGVSRETEKFRYDPDSTKNQGRVRLNDAAGFEKPWVTKKSGTRGITETWGTNKETGESELHALRFDKGLWPEEKATGWWEKNQGRFKKTWKWAEAKAEQVPAAPEKPANAVRMESQRARNQSKTLARTMIRQMPHPAEKKYAIAYLQWILKGRPAYKVPSYGKLPNGKVQSIRHDLDNIMDGVPPADMGKRETPAPTGAKAKLEKIKAEKSGTLKPTRFALQQRGVLPEEKPSWEMLLPEYLTSQGIKRWPKTSHQKRERAVKFYKRVIENAVEEGEAVPQPVLEQFRSRTDIIAGTPETIHEPWADEALAKMEATPPAAKEKLAETAKPEPAPDTPAEVAAEIKQAAVENIPKADRPVSVEKRRMATLDEFKAVLAQIDKAIEVAPEGARQVEGTETEELLTETKAGWRVESRKVSRRERTSFHIPGDGDFEIVNETKTLQTFRDRLIKMAEQWISPEDRKVLKAEQPAKEAKKQGSKALQWLEGKTLPEAYGKLRDATWETTVSYGDRARDDQAVLKVGDEYYEIRAKDAALVGKKYPDGQWSVAENAKKVIGFGDRFAVIYTKDGVQIAGLWARQYDENPAAFAAIEGGNIEYRNLPEPRIKEIEAEGKAISEKREEESRVAEAARKQRKDEYDAWERQRDKLNMAYQKALDRAGYLRSNPKDIAAMKRDLKAAGVSYKGVVRKRDIQNLVVAHNERVEAKVAPRHEEYFRVKENPPAFPEETWASAGRAMEATEEGAGRLEGAINGLLERTGARVKIEISPEKGVLRTIEALRYPEGSSVRQAGEAARKAGESTTAVPKRAEIDLRTGKVTIFQGGNLLDAVHEIAHWFREKTGLFTMAERSAIEEAYPKDASGEEFAKGAEEWFARKGTKGTKGVKTALQRAYRKFMEFLKNVGEALGLRKLTVEDVYGRIYRGEKGGKGEKGVKSEKREERRASGGREEEAGRQEETGWREMFRNFVGKHFEIVHKMEGVFNARKPASGLTIGKLAKVIKSAVKPARGETEVLYHKAREVTAAKLHRIFGEENVGEGTIPELLQAMKGPLPRAVLEPIGEKFTSRERESLFQHIMTHDKLREVPFEKADLSCQLESLMNYGTIPGDAAIAKFEEIFGSEVARSLLQRRGLGKRIGTIAAEIAGMAKSAKASFDLSASLRQGFEIGVAHPEIAKEGFKRQVQAFANEEFARQVDNELRYGPNAGKYKMHGLDLTQWESLSPDFQAREESFQSHFLQNLLRVQGKTTFGKGVLALPRLWGRGILASERAYCTHLNWLRAKVFDAGARLIEEDPGMTKGEKHFQLDMLAKNINVSTGRGSIRTNPWVNSLFFSPRWVVSRFEAPLRELATVGMGKGAVRMEALRLLGAKAFVWVGLYGLAAAAGATFGWDTKFNLDPRSVDFLKFRFGKTTVDFGAGYAQAARFVARLITGTSIGAGGQKQKVYGPLAGWTFLRYKLSPIPSVAVDVWSGKTFGGKAPTVLGEVSQLTVPIAVQSIPQLWKEHGAWGLGLLVPDMLGSNVQIYSNQRRTRRRRAGADSLDFSKGFGGFEGFGKLEWGQ